MFAFDNFEIGALYLIQDFMRTPKLTDFLESMTDLGNAGFIWLALAIVLICTKKYRKVGYATFLSHPDERHPEAYFQKGPPL